MKPSSPPKVNLDLVVIKELNISGVTGMSMDEFLDDLGCPPDEPKEPADGSANG